MCKTELDPIPPFVFSLQLYILHASSAAYQTGLARLRPVLERAAGAATLVLSGCLERRDFILRRLGCSKRSDNVQSDQHSGAGGAD